MPDVAALNGSVTDNDKDKDQMPSMGFLDHLEELRRRIIYSIIAVAVGFFACWGYADKIVGWMQQPIMEALKRNGMPQTLVYLNPTDPFNLYLKVGQGNQGQTERPLICRRMEIGERPVCPQFCPALTYHGA